MRLHLSKIFAATLFIAAHFVDPLSACGNCDKEDCKKSIQDSKKAEEHFDAKLAFETNPHGAKAVVDGKVKDVTIVDVRRADAFEKGHIPDAINIPYDKFNGFEGDEKEFKGLRKDGYNYVYCYELQCNLAAKAAKKFASLGYPVKEMVGGFDEWKKEEGHPVETGPTKEPAPQN